MDQASDIEWKVSAYPVPYLEALAEMEERVAAVQQGSARELVWLLEHPPLFTAGTSADPGELSNPRDFPVYPAGRGGRYTYHGPGQRVGYLVIDLGRRGKDIRKFVHALEGWMIDSLGRLGVAAHRAPGRIGIWVGSGDGEEKIGALGIRVKRWVTMHGFSINVAPDLAHFGGIVPCGIGHLGVTSLQKLGKDYAMGDLDLCLRKEFPSFIKDLAGGWKAP